MTPEQKLATAVLQQAWEEVATGKPAVTPPVLSKKQREAHKRIPATSRRSLKHGWLSYLSAVEVLVLPRSLWRRMLGLDVEPMLERVGAVLAEKFGDAYGQELLRQVEAGVKFDPPAWFADMRGADCAAWRQLRKKTPPKQTPTIDLDE